MNTLTARRTGATRYLIGASLLLVLALGMSAARIPRLMGELKANGADALGDFNYYYYAFTVAVDKPLEAWLMYDRGQLIAYLHQIGVKEIGVHSFYAYPPQFAVVFSWLGSFDLTTAKIVWSLMSLAFLVGGAMLTLSLAYRGGQRSVWILLIAIALLVRPVLDELYWGQSNALLFFLLAATFFCIDRGNRYAAGLFLALAIVFKVTPLAIAGLLLLRKEWRTVVATIVCSLAVTAIAVMQVGWSVVWHYVVSDLSRLNQQNLLVGGAPFNSSLRGALQTTFSTLGIQVPVTSLALVFTIFAAAVCLLSCYLTFRRNAQPRMDYALAVTTMLVISPVLESVHLVVVLIPLLIYGGTAMEQPAGTSLSALGWRAELLLGVLAIALLMFSPRFVSYTIAILLIYVLCVARYFPAGTQRERLLAPA